MVGASGDGDGSAGVPGMLTWLIMGVVDASGGRLTTVRSRSPSQYLIIWRVRGQLSKLQRLGNTYEVVKTTIRIACEYTKRQARSYRLPVQC